MGSHPVHRKMSVRATIFAGLLCSLVGRTAMAQDRPGFGAFELAGSWEGVRGESPFGEGLPVDSTGIPLNDEGRIRALSYNESQLSMVERQCIGWPDYYLLGGAVFGLKIWAETDPIKGSVISYTVGAWEDRPEMKIWMDGRPHPSEYAGHTRAGFTTGVWEGNTLVTYTTHMNAGILRRTGAPSSDEAKLTMRFYRYGDLMTVLGFIEDPIYLAEPWVVSNTYRASVTSVLPTGPPCLTAYEGSIGDTAPHYLPERNPFINEMTDKYGVPRDAVVGKPETLYPEYRKKIPTK